MSSNQALPSPTYHIPAMLLLIALLPLPYGFYTLLRLVVTICAGVIAHHQWRSGDKRIAFSMALIALLFNPFIPVYLAREIWGPIDVVCALFFTGVGYQSTNEPKQGE